jgi:acyl-CoA-binding protein
MATNQQDLKTQFLTAEASVSDNKVQAPESIRMKLYGLAKQIKEGDCRMPKPPE